MSLTLGALTTEPSKASTFVSDQASQARQMVLEE